MQTLFFVTHVQKAIVVDAYTARLLESLGYRFDSYGDIQEWLVEGILQNRKKIDSEYGKEMCLNEIYARFHGKIVEFCKENSCGKIVNGGKLGL